MKKLLVGMSGGVDSSVAAYLLQQQGYACEGVNLQRNWPRGREGSAQNDVEGVSCSAKPPRGRDRPHALEAILR